MTHKIFKYIFLFLIVSSNLCISGQDIKLIPEKSVSININVDSVIKDVNGDICSVFIIMSDRKGIKFYSNLGIEKVVFDSSEYKVWFPAKVSIIKIVVPGFPLYEQNVAKNMGPAFHIFKLEIPITEKVFSYRKDTATSVLITTFPIVAKVKEGNSVLGLTPLSVNYSELNAGTILTLSKFNHFTREVIADTLLLCKNYQVKMESFSARKRYYMLATIGILKGMGDPVYGIQLGKMGKFGFYVSAKGSVPQGFLSVEKKTSFALSGGLNMPLYITNLYLGGGYCRRYIDGSSVFYMYDNKVADNFFIDFGLIINLNPHLVMSFNTNLSKNFGPLGMDYIPFDYSVGIGVAL